MSFNWPRTRVLGVTLATIVAAGCGSNAGTESDDPADASATSSPAGSVASEPSESAASSPVAGTPEGFERHESSEGGFAISLPRGWEAVDLSSGDIDEIVAFLREDPQTASFADQLPALMEQGVAFWAITLDPESLEQGFATNLNVVVQPDVGMGQDAYVGANISFIEETFDVDVAREDVDLPIGSAVRADYEAEFTGAPPVHTTQYYLVVDDQGLIATFTRLAGEEFAHLDEEFSEIVQTWEVLP